MNESKDFYLMVTKLPGFKLLDEFVEVVRVVERQGGAISKTEPVGYCRKDRPLPAGYLTESIPLVVGYDCESNTWLDSVEVTVLV